MARAGVKSLLRRHSTILIIIPILSAMFTLASGFLLLYSPSPAYAQMAGFPIPWRTTVSVSCITEAGTHTSLHPIRISPCPSSFQTTVNWLYFATDVLIFTSIGYALIPIFRKPRTIGTLVAVLGGLLALTLASVPVFHEEIGTGYPIVYDRHGFPLAWLTFVTGNIVCGPGFSCPAGPQADLNWVSLAFDASVYVSIASVTLFILRPRFFNTPAKPSAEPLKTQNV